MQPITTQHLVQGTQSLSILGGLLQPWMCRCPVHCLGIAPTTSSQPQRHATSFARTQAMLYVFFPLCPSKLTARSSPGRLCTRSKYCFVARREQQTAHDDDLRLALPLRFGRRTARGTIDPTLETGQLPTAVPGSNSEDKAHVVRSLSISIEQTLQEASPLLRAQRHCTMAMVLEPPYIWQAYQTG